MINNRSVSMWGLNLKVANQAIALNKWSQTALRSTWLLLGYWVATISYT